jgi:hypothetical protein
MDRRAEDQTATRLAGIDDRLDKGSARMWDMSKQLDKQAERLDDLRDELAANTAATQDVRELLSVARGGLKVLGWLGVGAKWVGAVAAAITALWVLLHQLTHNGHLPK